MGAMRSHCLKGTEFLVWGDEKVLEIDNYTFKKRLRLQILLYIFSTVFLN